MKETLPTTDSPISYPNGVDVVQNEPPITLTANVMVNVFNVNGDFSVENNTISLTGAANDTFIFNISGADGLNLSGVTMILTGGLVASDIVFNVSNTSANISIFNSTVDGTFYTSSNDPINDNGQINVSALPNETSTVNWGAGRWGRR